MCMHILRLIRYQVPTPVCSHSKKEHTPLRKIFKRESQDYTFKLHMSNRQAMATWPDTHPNKHRTKKFVFFNSPENFFQLIYHVMKRCGHLCHMPKNIKIKFRNELLIKYKTLTIKGRKACFSYTQQFHTVQVTVEAYLLCTIQRLQGPTSFP